MTLRRHMTKIVATIGPACDSPETLVAMIAAGMDIARLNLLHGTIQEHASRIERLRAAAAAAGRDLTILADLPGPKIRIGNFAGHEPVELRRGDEFTLTTADVPGDRHRVSVNLSSLPQAVRPNDMLYLNDGLIRLKVAEARENEIHCLIVAGGLLHSRKGVNLPGIDLGISAFTDQDREWLRFALERGVDAIGQSFVNSAADVQAVRAAAAGSGRSPFIIAKIERLQAVERVEAILHAADGIMIARGDLGVETPIESIAIVQKDLIRRAMHAGKPVITATQMLESMTRSRQPTRAEATDVANAILDGTDCVMLSAESAAGDYPVESVAMLAAIAAATEPHRKRFGKSPLTTDEASLAVECSLATVGQGGIAAHVPELIARSIASVLNTTNAAAIGVLPGAEFSVAGLARLRMPVWVVAFSSSTEQRRRMAIFGGVAPFAPPAAIDDRAAAVRRWIRSEGLAGRVAVLIHGPSSGEGLHNIRIELMDVDTPPAAEGTRQ